MLCRTPLCCRVVAAGWLLSIAGVRLNAQLPANSPFQPLPSSTPIAAPDSTLRYGGYVRTSEGVQYRFTDSARRAAAFVKLHQRDEALGLTVKAHDAQRNTVTVEYQGRTKTLAEPQGRIVSGGMPALTARPVVNPAMPAVPAVAPMSTAQDEQRRLDGVAADIAERRRLREQALSTPGSAQAPTPQASPR